VCALDGALKTRFSTCEAGAHAGRVVDHDGDGDGRPAAAAERDARAAHQRPCAEQGQAQDHQRSQQQQAAVFQAAALARGGARDRNQRGGRERLLVGATAAQQVCQRGRGDQQR
jgi:hypothetical protein